MWVSHSHYVVQYIMLNVAQFKDEAVFQFFDADIDAAINVYT